MLESGISANIYDASKIKLPYRHFHPLKDLPFPS